MKHFLTSTRRNLQKYRLLSGPESGSYQGGIFRHLDVIAITYSL